MTYRTAEAFRQALLKRLTLQAEGGDVNRLLRQVAFDRFLARLFYTGQERWVLKGGYALELRADRSRATKDLDLNIPPPPAPDVLEDLRDAAEQDLGDFFVFRIRQAKGKLAGPPLGGYRFHVEVYLDKKRFTGFPLDVGQGDVTRDAEWLDIDTLAFAGLAPARIAIYPLEDHFAEKLHAYTTPRENPSRVKDLVDMLLILDLGLEPTPDLKQSIELTFARYGRHGLPDVLPGPPESWQTPFATLAAEVGLDGAMANAYQMLRDFLQVLGLGR